MKKILVSLSIIGAVAGIAIGGTIAYFSDVETSTGNTLSAGTLNLRVDSLGSYYKGQMIANSFWYPPRELTNEKFYTVSDLKPGDNVLLNISLHIDGNPAWICLGARNKQDLENILTEPETDAGDMTADKGELSKQIHVLVWRDKNANSQHDPGETFLADSFFDVFVEIPIRDSTTGTGPLTEEIPIEMVAMDLCGGSHIVHPMTGRISCDGSTMNNTAQSDSLSADIILFAHQFQNNPNFQCSAVNLP